MCGHQRRVNPEQSLRRISTAPRRTAPQRRSAASSFDRSLAWDHGRSHHPGSRRSAWPAQATLMTAVGPATRGLDPRTRKPVETVTTQPICAAQDGYSRPASSAVDPGCQGDWRSTWRSTAGMPDRQPGSVLAGKATREVVRHGRHPQPDAQLHQHEHTHVTSTCAGQQWEHMDTSHDHGHNHAAVSHAPSPPDPNKEHGREAHIHDHDHEQSAHPPADADRSCHRPGTALPTFAQVPSGPDGLDSRVAAG
jgi:hypothetical protein